MNDRFIDALRIVARREDLVIGGPIGYDINSDTLLDSHLASSCSDGIYPPIFHKYRDKGIYCFRFFNASNKPIYVLVDEQVPVTAKNKIIFGQSANPNEMWVQLIEKAYAKMVGGYKNAAGGEFSEHFFALTGRKILKKIWLKRKRNLVKIYQM